MSWKSVEAYESAIRVQLIASIVIMLFAWLSGRYTMILVTIMYMLIVIYIFIKYEPDIDNKDIMVGYAEWLNCGNSGTLRDYVRSVGVDEKD